MMVQPLHFLLLGLGLGAMYGLAAQGIVLIYRGSGVLNFAQGAVAVVAAVVYADATDAGWGAAPALVAGVAAAAVCGALIHLLVMQPLRDAAPLMRLVASLGVMTVLQSGATLHIGAQQRFVPELLPATSVQPLHGVVLGVDRLWLLAIGVALTGLLWVCYRFTRFGLQTTAVAENPRASAALGHSPGRIALANWTSGSALAGLAGCLLVPITGLSVDQLTLLVLPALAAALVGGFSSFPLAMLGGCAVGVAESELTRYVSAPGWAEAAPLLVIIVILVGRGRALPGRNELTERLPRVGSGRSQWVTGGAVVVIAGVAIGLSGPELTDALTTTLITGIICLSLVVVTGYAGQVSLAQYALAGLGAFAAAKVSASLGWPFLVAVAAGTLAAVPVGMVVGIPALRTRGANLAIATLGLALVAADVVFANPSFTGGFNGIPVRVPSIAGVDLDPITHSGRYATVCLLALAGTGLVVTNLRRGRAGRRLVAVRENERAAAALGISVAGAKLYAFGLASALAGLAGALTAFRSHYVLFGSFDVFPSIAVVVVAAIGGIGYLIGGVLGGVLIAGGVLTYVADRLLGIDRYVPLISGALVLVTVRLAPDGAAETVRRLVRRLAPTRRHVAAVARTGAVSRPVVRAATLEADGVRVRFGGVVALDGVSLTVRPGQIVGLIGPNGAGKTTFIDAVAGLAPVSSGTIALSGRPIGRWSPYRRARAGIGRSFQSVELFEDMTVGDNLRTAAEERDRRAYLTDLLWPRSRPLSDAALTAVADFGLADTLERYPRQLSHGQRRIIGIARAVAARSSILLLDEPAAGLDGHEVRELAALMRRLAREWGIGVLLVEHDVELVMDVCDTVVALDFGALIAEGPPAHVRSHPAVVAAYLGDAEDVAEGMTR